MLMCCGPAEMVSRPGGRTFPTPGIKRGHRNSRSVKPNLLITVEKLCLFPLFFKIVTYRLLPLNVPLIQLSLALSE